MTDGSKPSELIFTRLKPHHRTPDLTGMRFGRLEVQGYAGADGRKSWWRVRCDCGTSKLSIGTELRKGRTQSCGCLQREQASARQTTHGMSRHAAYAVWSNMLDRCELPTHFAYPRYGGRGITVCARWRSFSAFWADMGPSWRKGLTIERKNNNAGYSPENCEWRDRKAQARNKRDNVTIDTPKGRMLVCEAAEVSGINVTTILYRVGAGWPTSLLFLPPDSSRRVM